MQIQVQAVTSRKVRGIVAVNSCMEVRGLPPEDEDGSNGWQEIPCRGFRAQQAVHVHVAGGVHPQVLVVGRNLLSEHHLKVPYMHKGQVQAVDMW